MHFMFLKLKVYNYLTEMVKRHKESIHIISQYNAQCSEIRKRLQSKGVDGEEVSTVVSSQGKVFKIFYYF